MLVVDDEVGVLCEEDANISSLVAAAAAAAVARSLWAACHGISCQLDLR